MTPRCSSHANIAALASFFEDDTSVANPVGAGGVSAVVNERSRFIREGEIYRGGGAPRKVLSISYAGNVRWVHATDDPRDQPQDCSLEEFERWAGFVANP